MGIGVVAGFLASEFLGRVDRRRMGRAVGRITSGQRSGAAPEELELEAMEAFRRNHAMRGARVRATAIGDGVIELTGVVPSEKLRDMAGDLARNRTRASVVINRILVQGLDIPAEPAGGTASTS